MPAAFGKSKTVGEKIGENMDSFAFKEEEALVVIWAFSTQIPVFQQFRHRHLQRHLHRRHHRHRRHHHHLLVLIYLAGIAKMVIRVTLMTITTIAHPMDKRAVVGIRNLGVSLQIGMTATVTLLWMRVVLAVAVPQHLAPTLPVGRIKMVTHATLMTIITTAHLMGRRAAVGTHSHGVSSQIGMTATATLPWMLAALAVVVLRGSSLFDARLSTFFFFCWLSLCC